jgi:hypothetical protein
VPQEAVQVSSIDGNSADSERPESARIPEQQESPLAAFTVFDREADTRHNPRLELALEAVKEAIAPLPCQSKDPPKYLSVSACEKDNLTGIQIDVSAVPTAEELRVIGTAAMGIVLRYRMPEEPLRLVAAFRYKRKAIQEKNEKPYIQCIGETLTEEELSATQRLLSDQLGPGAVVRLIRDPHNRVRFRIAGNLDSSVADMSSLTEVTGVQVEFDREYKHSRFMVISVTVDPVIRVEEFLERLTHEQRSEIIGALYERGDTSQAAYNREALRRLKEQGVVIPRHLEPLIDSSKRNPSRLIHESHQRRTYPWRGVAWER